MSIQLGRYNSLQVIRLNEYGAFLGLKEEFAEDADMFQSERETILLPRRYVPEGTEIDDMLDVFVYLDSDDRPIATTETPLAQVGQFKLLRCLEVNRVGAFMDWGLSKDLLVPFGQQFKPLQAGRSYLVYLYTDTASKRIVATAKLDRVLDKTESSYEKAQAVDVIVRRKTDLGYLCIINGEHSGLIFRDQNFKPLKIGEEIKAFIHEVRADGKISLSLHKGASQAKDSLAQVILSMMDDNDGFLPLNDKSSPQDIYHQFKVSKAIFKKTLGKLYKERKIAIKSDGIHKLS